VNCTGYPGDFNLGQGALLAAFIPLMAFDVTDRVSSRDTQVQRDNLSAVDSVCSSQFAVAAIAKVG